MSSQFKKVAVIGAGGNFGPYVLNALRDASFDITVITRPDSKSTFPSFVQVVKSDYSAASLVQAFKGQDAIISTIAERSLKDQFNLIDAAVEAGVKRFIPSEFGSDTSNPKTLEVVPIFVDKRSVTEYLKSKEDQISWTSIINSGLADFCLKLGFFGYNIKEKTATIYDDGNVPFSATTTTATSEAVVKVLQKPLETKNQYVYVHSYTATQNEVLQSFEKATGEKWTVQKASTKDVIAEATEKHKAGDPYAIYSLVVAALYLPEALADLRKVPGGLWNERLGLAEESLDDVVKSVI